DAPAHDARGRATYSPRTPSQAVDVTGYATFRQVAFTGSFEGQTLIGLGVRARLPMRAFVLDGPGDGSRLVIDVAHRWRAPGPRPRRPPTPRRRQSPRRRSAPHPRPRPGGRRGRASR